MQRTIVRTGILDPEIQTMLKEIHGAATQVTQHAHNWLTSSGFTPEAAERLTRQFGLGTLHLGSDKQTVVSRLLSGGWGFPISYLGMPLDPNDPETTLLHSAYLFQHRLWIPVIDLHGNVVNVDGRTLLDSPLIAKYLPLKGTGREWIWNEAALQQSTTIFIVEGVKDGLAVHELCRDLPGADAIAVGGTGGMVSESVRERLTAYKNAAAVMGDTLNYVLIPDNDVQGQAAAEALADHIGGVILSLAGLGKGDPADHFKSGQLTPDWLADWELFGVKPRPVAEIQELDALLREFGTGAAGGVRHRSSSSEEIEERRAHIKTLNVGILLNALDPSLEAPLEGEGKVRCINAPHHIDHKASMHVYPQRRYGKHPQTHVKCYACGYFGDAFDILASMCPEEFGGGMGGENFLRMLDRLEDLFGVGGAR
ncbi:toprim domain-containing protein [Deinococcus sp. 6YEL10]|uniref:hypothetical protein n=1 Tax=Deinococcus sp. 6YEL10 TaxID=2745870 RepID=UPI001E2E5243|nr:hypothetical protein [Deinococcus sp. 6YEL10]MCD0159734.1 toprim domain-containing protein [Deinococcus sp. 6YEL10]